MPIQNFTVAGEQLARKRTDRAGESGLLVIALSPNGVFVAHEIAKALKADLDILIARNLRAPGNQSVTIGAVAPNGVRIVDKALIEELNVSPEDLELASGWERSEIMRRPNRYRGDVPPPDLRNRPVIVVDEGMNSGFKAWAAIRAIQKLGPARITLAVPAASAEAVELLTELVPDVVLVADPADFQSVKDAYVHYRTVQDQEVLDLLAERRTQGVAP